MVSRQKLTCENDKVTDLNTHTHIRTHTQHTYLCTILYNLHTCCIVHTLTHTTPHSTYTLLHKIHVHTETEIGISDMWLEVQHTILRTPFPHTLTQIKHHRQYMLRTHSFPHIHVLYTQRTHAHTHTHTHTHTQTNLHLP